MVHGIFHVIIEQILKIKFYNLSNKLADPSWYHYSSESRRVLVSVHNSLLSTTVSCPQQFNYENGHNVCAPHFQSINLQWKRRLLGYARRAIYGVKESKTEYLRKMSFFS